MEIRPVDLPALRDEIVEWAATNLIAWHVFSGAIYSYAGTRPARQYAAEMARTEANNLPKADLFYVGKEMLDVAWAAAKSIPDFTLAAEDLPTLRGFLAFESAMDAWDDQEAENGGVCRREIRAVAWRSFDDQLDLTWYADRDVEFSSASPPHSARAMQSIRAAYPRMFPTNALPVPLSATQQPMRIWSRVLEREVHPSESTGTGSWLVLLKTIWLLMAQPLASVEDAQYDRAARRRIQRQGKKPPRVRVITLRRPAGSGGSGESDREWHHQWIVRGHWRQQWYPARQVHRPVWIAPHVKGPEGKPMLGGEKVYALRK